MNTTRPVLDYRHRPVEDRRRLSRFAVVTAGIALVTSTPLMFVWGFAAQWAGVDDWFFEALIGLFVLPLFSLGMSFVALGRVDDAPLRGRRLSVAAILVSGLSAIAGGCVGYAIFAEAMNC